MDLRNWTDGRGSVEIISEHPDQLSVCKNQLLRVSVVVVAVGSCSYRPAEAAFFCFKLFGWAEQRTWKWVKWGRSWDFSSFSPSGFLSMNRWMIENIIIVYEYLGCTTTRWWSVVLLWLRGSIENTRSFWKRTHCSSLIAQFFIISCFTGQQCSRTQRIKRLFQLLFHTKENTNTRQWMEI